VNPGRASIVLIGDEALSCAKNTPACACQSDFLRDHASEREEWRVGRDLRPQEEGLLHQHRARLEKEHKTHAMVSAGNTGAVVAAALFGLGRIESVQRPANRHRAAHAARERGHPGRGATSDCKPYHLHQFAMMGSIYARLVLHVERPRWGS